MNSFFYLFRTKIKGSVRVQFSSLGTGMAVIFTVLIYGILIGTIFTSSVPYDKETMYLQVTWQFWQALVLRLSFQCCR